jgi:NAD(P)H-flavin reductase
VSTLELRVSHVRRTTPATRQIQLDLAGASFSYQPGQAVILGIDDDVRMPYSIASAPIDTEVEGYLEFLTRIEPGNRLGDVKRGSRVVLQGPFGSFIFPPAPAEQHFLFVAGGTGIAPLRSMMDHALRRHPTLAISLLYSARRADEFAFIDELRAHARQGRIELHQTVTRDESAAWAGNRGRIGRAHFESVLHDAPTTLCFVCGPRQMVSESVATLQALGVPLAAIRTEAWAVPEATARE